MPRLDSRDVAGEAARGGAAAGWLAPYRGFSPEIFVRARDAGSVVLVALAKRTRVAASYDQSFGNSPDLPAYLCAKHARDQGVTTALAGDGGGELFGGNPRCATEKLFTVYEPLPEFPKRSLIEPIALRLPSRSPPSVRSGARYVANARLRIPGQQQLHNLLMRMGVASVSTPEFRPTSTWAICAVRGRKLRCRFNEVLRDVARDAVEALRRRGIIRSKPRRDLVDERIGEHAGYCSELISVLMMPERRLIRYSAATGNPRVGPLRSAEPSL